MRRRLVTTWILLCCVAALAWPVPAQTVRPDRSGVKPQVLSLPSGPGSIEGLGESFKPNLNTGMVSYQVKLALPPAVNGHKPDLALVYNSGAGNGPFGLGWSIPLFYVQRQTDKGLPTYTDQDTFIYYNQEELVPLDDGTFWGKNEGEFVRLRRVSGYWEGTAKNGTRLVFGQSTTARIATPAGVFQWLLDQSIDPNGNVVQFTYQQDQGQAYLKEVRYNLFGKNNNSVVFNYEARPDRVPDYRSRYKVTTGLRCASIEIRSRGALQRRYVLEYLPNTIFSMLRRVTLLGRDGQTTLPPVTFSYTSAAANPALLPMENAPRVSFTDTPNIELVDANGDGLPDILVGEKGNYRYFQNMGRCIWARTTTGMANSPTFDFEPLENTLGDYNASGITGVVHKGKDYLYYPNMGGGFGGAQVATTNPAYQFTDGSVQMVDLNSDKRPDVLQGILSAGQNLFYVWINQGNNRWSDRIAVARPDPARTLLTNDPRVQLADMNGDRMLDLVWVNSGQIEYYPLKGYNRLGGPGQSLFDSKVAMQNAPSFDLEHPPRMIDVNNDGLADLVSVEAGRVRYWLNLGNNQFGPERVITGTPTLAGGYRFADMMGGGTTGVLWYDNARQHQVYLDFINSLKPNLLTKVENGLGRAINFEYKNSIEYYIEAQRANNPWCTKPPFAVPVLSRLRVKDLNSNQEYITDYEYRDGYYNADQREFRGFEFVKTIERGDSTALMLVALYHYDMGRTEESLKGKLLTVQLLSDDFVIRCNGPDPDPTQLFRRAVYRYTTRTLYTGTNGVPVKYSFNSLQSTFFFEKTDQPREVDEEFDQDNFGNEVRRVEYNDITDGVVPAWQRVTLTEYAMDLTAYVVDKPSRSYVTDGDGQFVSETLFYYDGPDYLGLPRGQITRGNLTRKSQRLGPNSTSNDRFIDVERRRYDQYGNVIGILDGLGDASNPTAGHARAVTYDPVFHTYPIEERIYKERGQSLVIAAEYDYGFGVVTAATDPAGQRTLYAYDALARLTAIAKPGDTLALPTERYSYTLASPVSSIRTEKRERSGQASVVEMVQYVDGLGRTLQIKEKAGANRSVMKDAVTFNRRGTVYEKYLPYFTSTQNYEPVDTAKPKTQTLYDSVGREVQVMQPVGGFSRTVYQPLQRTVYDEEQANPASSHYNKPRTLTYDGLDRLIRLDERNGKETYTTSYAYDLLNNLTYAQDALGNETFFTYDGAKRRVSRQDPDRGLRTFTYDDTGNLIETLDGNGQMLRNRFDAMNRLMAQDFVVGNAVTRHATFHYDNDLPSDHRELTNTMNRLAYVEDLTGRSLFSYDARGQVITEIRDVQDIGSYTTRFTYDAMGRIASLTYPDGMVVTHTYDARGLLAALPNYASAIEYAASGKLARLQFQNGTETTYSYDVRQRLTALRTMSPGASPSMIQDLSYTLDGVNNIVGIADGRPMISDAHNATENFVYDDLYRLMQAQGRYGSINLGYDASNNLTSKTSSVARPDLDIGMFSYGEAGAHQVTSAGNWTFTYDGNGNLLTRTGFTYTWDARNRLVSALGDDGSETDFTYDYADRRVTKTNGDNTVVYINRYAELRNGQLVKYVFANERRVAQVNADGTVGFYHTDHLGSTNIVTNAAGAVIERIQYYAYGTERIREGSFRAAYRYIDRELDESTGLYHLGARYYAHELGMFLSPDPVDFDPVLTQTLNPYDYSRHNPYNYLDPDGTDLLGIGKFVERVAKSVGDFIESVGDKVVQFGKDAAPVFSVIGKILGAAGAIVGLIPGGQLIGGVLALGGLVYGAGGPIISAGGRLLQAAGQVLQGKREEAADTLGEGTKRFLKGDEASGETGVGNNFIVDVVKGVGGVAKSSTDEQGERKKKNPGRE